MTNALIGGCLCGKTRYMCRTAPAFSIVCCCRQCQKLTGAGHAPQFAVAKEFVTLDGAVKTFALTADSANAVEAATCVHCASPLYKTTSGHPSFYFFYAATLDEPARYTPQRIVWARSRQPWDPLPVGIPVEL